MTNTIGVVQGGLWKQSKKKCGKIQCTKYDMRNTSQLGIIANTVDPWTKQV